MFVATKIKENYTMDADKQLPVQYQPNRQRHSQSSPKIVNYIIGSGALIIVGAVSFFGGIQVGESHTAAQDQNQQANNMHAGSGFGTGTGGRRMGTIGSVTAITDSSITILDERTNENTTYRITADTTITKNGTAVALSSITKNETVMIRVSGTRLVASSITVDPSMTQAPAGQGTSSGDSSTADPTTNT
jgi:hypothetical protein